MKLSNINPFAFGANPPPIQPTTATPLVVKQPAETGAENPAALASASNTVGVNTNRPIGDVAYIPPQAGKPAGIGKTIGFA